MAEALRPLPTLTLTENLAVEPLPELTQAHKNEMLRSSLLERVHKLQAVADADSTSQAAHYRGPLDAMTIFLNNLSTKFSKESDPQVIATHLGIYANTLNTIENPILDPEANLGADVVALRRRKETVLADAKARLEPLRGKIDRHTGESLLTTEQKAGLQALGQIHLHYKKWDELIAQLETTEDEAARSSIEAKIDTRVHLLTKLLDTVQYATPRVETVTLPVAAQVAPTVLREPMAPDVPVHREVSAEPAGDVSLVVATAPKSNVIDFPSRAPSSVEERHEVTEQPVLDAERWGRVKRIAWQAVKSVVLAGFVLVNNADKNEETSAAATSGVALSDIYTPIPKQAAWVTEADVPSVAETIAPVVIEQSDATVQPEPEPESLVVEEQKTPKVLQPAEEEKVVITETMPEGLMPIASLELNDTILPSQLDESVSVPEIVVLDSSTDEVIDTLNEKDAEMVVPPVAETIKEPTLTFGEGESNVPMVDAITQGYRVETAFLAKASQLIADLPEAERTAIAMEVYQKIRTDRELQRSMGLDEGPDMYFIGDSINYTEPLRLVNEQAKPVREAHSSSENLLRATTPDTSVSYEPVSAQGETADTPLVEKTEDMIGYEGTEAELLIEVDQFLNRSIMTEAGQTAWQDAWGESKMLKLLRDITVGDMTTIAVLQGNEYIEACRSFGISPKDFGELYKQVIVAARDNQVLVDGRALSREGAFASAIPVVDVLKAVYLQLHYKK